MMSSATPPSRSFLPTSIQRYSIPEKKPGYPWMELYGAFVAAVSFFCCGIVQSYTSVAIFSLQNDVAFNISVSQSDISWIASAPPLASLFGTIVSGPIMENLGRQKTITLLSLPLIIGWLIIGTAFNVPMIIVGRFTTGISMGMARASAPVYVSETSRAQHRGKLGYLPLTLSALGVLLGCVMGSVWNWKQLALIMASFPALLFFSSIFLPESPCWLIKNNQEDQAFRSLKRLRHRRGNPNEEMYIYKEIHEIRESLEEAAHEEEVSMSESKEIKQGMIHLLQQPSIRFPAMLVFCLMTFQQFSGVSAVIYFMKMILNHGQGIGSSSSNNAHGNDIRPAIVGIVHFLAFFISLPLVDRVGRKFLLRVSGILMTLSHLVLAYYFYFYIPSSTSFTAPPPVPSLVVRSSSNNNSNINLLISNNDSSLIHLHVNESSSSQLSWLPLVCLCSYIASFSLASPIPFILMSELFGTTVRSYLCSAATLVCSIASFLVVHMFPILMYDVSPTFTFILFAFFSFQSTLISVIMPETKGKSLAEIENLFRAPRDFKGKAKEMVDCEPCVQVSVVMSPMHKY